MSTDRTTVAAQSASPWVERFARLIRKQGRVLDVACGQGRHTRLLAGMGHQVEAVDRDATTIRALSGIDRVSAACVDLESEDWPYAGQAFEAVVVTNYLFRPLLPRIIELLEPNGLLIYETFMIGNEQFGSPRNPDFLLHENELLELVQGRMHIIAFEQGEVFQPRRAMIQRLCARSCGTITHLRS